MSVRLLSEKSVRLGKPKERKLSVLHFATGQVRDRCAKGKQG